MNKPNISRRNFMRLAGGAVAGAGLAGILGCHDEKKVIVQGGVSPFCSHPDPSDFTTFIFDPSGFGSYDLEFTNKELIFYDMPLIGTDGLQLQTGDASRLKTREGSPIGIGEYFVLNRPKSNDTHVLKYLSNDTANRIVDFSDLGTGTRQSAYDQNGLGALIVAGQTHNFSVNPDGSLDIDLDADGVNGNGIARIVNKYGAILELDDSPEPEPAHMKLIMPKERFCGTEDEIVDIYARKVGQSMTIDVPDQKNVTFSYDSSSGFWVGKTKGYGTKINVDRTNTPGQVIIQTTDQHAKW